MKTRSLLLIIFLAGLSVFILLRSLDLGFAPTMCEFHCRSASAEFFDCLTPEFTFICLKTNRERHEHVKKLIKQHTLCATIFSALDGTKISYAKYVDQGYITLKATQQMREGAIGCGISHIKVWENFISSGKAHLTIFEDDVWFNPDFNRHYANFMQHVPADFDLCQLLHHPTKWARESKLKFGRKIDEYICEGYPQPGLVGYVISQKGARKLIGLVTPMVKPIDNMIIDHIRSKTLISYCPVEQFIKMPYKYKSNIWTTNSRK